MHWQCNSTRQDENRDYLQFSIASSFPVKLLSFSPPLFLLLLSLLFLVPFFGPHSKRRFISKRERREGGIVDNVEATWTASDPSPFSFQPETTLIVQTVVGLYLDRYNGDRRVSWGRGEGTVSRRNVVIVFERARYLIVSGLLACPR